MLNIIKTNLSYRSMTPRTIDKIDRIILHHAAATNCSAEDIHRWHLNKGWAGIGYNFLVRKDGSVYECRPIEYVPAHATNFNTCSIGICFEGNFEEEEMGKEQKEAGKELVAYLKQKYNLNLVQRHKDVQATSCPGRNFPFEDMANRQIVENVVVEDKNTNENKKLDIFSDGKINCIYDIQEWLNNKYGFNLALDNIYGTETHKALVKSLQTELNVQYNKGLKVDGIFGDKTYKACINVRKGASGNITMLIKMALFTKGYNIEINKIFDDDTENKVADFQNKNKLIADKVVGRNTFKALFI